MSERRDPARDELMRGIDTEQLLADWFHEEAPKQEPPLLLPATLARTAMTRQRRKWLTRVWWLTLLGFADRRPPTMMVSIGFVAVLTALTLLALLVVAPGQSDEQIPPPDGALVVALDGSGEYETIEEAMVDATDGDVVFIKPGEYTAAVRTERSVAFLGGGTDRADVVIRAAPSARQPFETRDTTTRFERLSIAAGASDSQQLAENAGVRIVKGTVLFDDVSFSGIDRGCAIESVYESDAIWAGVDVGIDITVRRSSLTDGTTGFCGGPVDSLRVEDSVFRGLGAGIAIDGNLEIIDSTFEENTTALDVAGGLQLTGSRFERNGAALIASDGGIDSDWVIVGNAFDDNDAAMTLGFGGFDVRDNIVRGGETGLRVTGGRRGSIAGNEFSDVAGTAVVAREARATFEGNTVTGGGGGISIEGGAPDVLENRVQGVDGTAIAVGSGTGGSVVGNQLCGNGSDIEVAPGAETTVSDNLVCEG